MTVLVVSVVVRIYSSQKHGIVFMWETHVSLRSLWKIPDHSVKHNMSHTHMHKTRRPIPARHLASHVPRLARVSRGVPPFAGEPEEGLKRARSLWSGVLTEAGRVSLQALSASRRPATRSSASPGLQSGGRRASVTGSSDESGLDDGERQHRGSILVCRAWNNTAAEQSPPVPAACLDDVLIVEVMVRFVGSGVDVCAPALCLCCGSHASAAACCALARALARNQTPGPQRWIGLWWSGWAFEVHRPGAELRVCQAAFGRRLLNSTMTSSIPILSEGSSPEPLPRKKPTIC